MGSPRELVIQGSSLGRGWPAALQLAGSHLFIPSRRGPLFPACSRLFPLRFYSILQYRVLVDSSSICRPVRVRPSTSEYVLVAEAEIDERERTRGIMSTQASRMKAEQFEAREKAYVSEESEGEVR